MSNKKTFIILLFVTTTAFLLYTCYSETDKNDVLYSSLRFNNTPDSLKKLKQYIELKAVINHLKPQVKNVKNPLDSAVIIISVQGKLFAKFYTNSKGKCNFKLPLDKYYKIEVTKKGYVTKFIELNTTKIPKSKQGEFSFPFEMDLFLYAPELDITILQQPIAKIRYSAAYNGFDYDVNYTNSINKELKTLHENYYMLKKVDKEIDSLILQQQK